MTVRRVFVAGALALVLSGATALPAGAAGGKGASMCSVAGTTGTPGSIIIEARVDRGGFGGVGNDGLNPGFVGPGASPGCNPTN